MYLPLAERLIEKYVEEKKVDGEAGGSQTTGVWGKGGEEGVQSGVWVRLISQSTAPSW